ncbi:MAG: hypothetical protein KAT68_00960 [Bacteroidales bacterium]|nr:hypothetical protein [Bacteroidales bacterium]
MRKIILLSIFYLFVNNCYSKEYPGEYFTNSNDTIRCMINVKVNIIYKDLINPLSCKYSVKIIEIEGGKKKLTPHQIKGFRIENTSEGVMIFESVTIENKGTFFVQKLEEGEITLYKYFYPHGYDYSVQFHYLVKKENEYCFLHLFGFRKALSKYIKDNEEIYQSLTNKEYNYKNIQEVIELYNNTND